MTTFLHIAVVLSPFLALPLTGWLASRGAASARLLALIPAALTAYFGYAYLMLLSAGPFTVTSTWARELNLSLSFYFDGLSTLFALLIAGIGTLIVLYAARYLDKGRGKFFVALFAFMGSMLGLVLSDNVIGLFVFWELTGFTSFLLIGFDHERPAARAAAIQALIVTGGGGLALLAAAVLLTQATGTASLALMVQGGSLAGDPRYVGIVLLLLLAAFTKSAQFPFHFWLPNAMEAPTPVSAYLHSATMVKAGVYLIARMTPIAGGSTMWTGTILVFAALTMVIGAVRAVTETDLKRVLAYSTIGALGILVLLFGIGTTQAAAAGLVYLIAHACYKGSLFLVAGSLEHETGTRDVASLGGLRRAMPITTVAAVLAAASMAGIPLFFGFIAKESFYETVSAVNTAGGLLMTLAVIASVCLGTAGFVAGIAPFHGEPNPTRGAHETSPAMWIGPLLLACAGVVLGIVPMLAAGPVSLATGAVTGAASAVTLELWHGFTPTLLLSVVTLAGSLLLFVQRGRLWRLRWPAALHSERLYSGTLSGIDGIGRRIAPALQSASLRSYVLTVLVTALTLAAIALVANGVLPTPRRWTPIVFHEAMLVLIVVAAAIAAALAQSNMAAVLSLGTVGYGVAVLYALLGAPDLAMTQFAVETLTVVIFVLVFYRLRGFADLSSRMVKLRDAAVALCAGALVTTLVLFVGASGTTSRLAEYFAEAAPRLAHGLNVVNVILVDFRGFDTLGEATVLVTVAVGVRALLLIGRERRP
ncbi:MAG TPA: hydrogen gas-evolving membrane-bound hydrogenase subunit E [Vicinamibacterales bacterium]|nr:hydrogen gas-evolving membrane-bound hydrogenase subunit E [Vicinamibacterales bacterium]